MHNDVVKDVSYAGLVMRGDILGLARWRRWADEEQLEIVSSVGVGAATVTQVALQLASGRGLRFDPTLEMVTLTQVCSDQTQYGSLLVAPKGRRPMRKANL